MDRIITPIIIHQPAIIASRALHYNEEERKRNQAERRHHEESDKEEQSRAGDPLPESESSVGIKIHVQF